MRWWWNILRSQVNYQVKLPGKFSSRKNLTDSIFHQRKTQLWCWKLFLVSDRHWWYEIMQTRGEKRSSHISFTSSAVKGQNHKGKFCVFSAFLCDFSTHRFCEATVGGRRCGLADAGSFIRRPIKSLLQLNHISALHYAPSVRRAKCLHANTLGCCCQWSLLGMWTSHEQSWWNLKKSFIGFYWVNIFEKSDSCNIK